MSSLPMTGNSFLDFVDNVGDWIPGGVSAIPSWLAGIMSGRKPAYADPSVAAPYFQQIGALAGDAANFTADQANFYNTYYRPAAVSFNERAQGVGGMADQSAAADRNMANFRSAYNAKMADMQRTMRGVNPNSGGAMARRGALEASYAPGLVDAANKGRMEREKYGDTLRATALPFMATQPNFGLPASMYSAGGLGMANLSSLANANYRQRIADTTKAFKLPFDLSDEKQRKAAADKWKEIINRFPGARPPAWGSDASAPLSSPMSPNYGSASPAEMAWAQEQDRLAFPDVQEFPAIPESINYDYGLGEDWL